MGKTLFWLYVVAVLMGLLACESTNKTTDAGTYTVVITYSADSSVLSKLVVIR